MSRKAGCSSCPSRLLPQVIQIVIYIAWLKIEYNRFGTLDFAGAAGATTRAMHKACGGGDFADGEAPEVTYHRCLDNQIDTELRGIQEAD